MTYFHEINTNSQSDEVLSEENERIWKRKISKKNWRIVKLPNGYYQSEYLYDGKWIDVTRRSTIDSCEKAIDESIDYYKNKLEPAIMPIVVKTFE